MKKNLEKFSKIFSKEKPKKLKILIPEILGKISPNDNIILPNVENNKH